MMNSYELSKLICKCLVDECDDIDDLEETETILYNELSQLSNDSFIKVALLQLCKKVLID